MAVGREKLRGPASQQTLILTMTSCVRMSVSVGACALALQAAPKQGRRGGKGGPHQEVPQLRRVEGPGQDEGGHAEQGDRDGRAAQSGRGAARRGSHRTVLEPRVPAQGDADLYKVVPAVHGVDVFQAHLPGQMAPQEQTVRLALGASWLLWPDDCLHDWFRSLRCPSLVTRALPCVR